MISLMRSAESFTSAGMAGLSNTSAFDTPLPGHITHGVLQLIEPQHQLRQSLQQFIAEGFASHYQADVQQFMPYLLGVALSGRWQAALGIRFAASGSLFTEQYLSSPAELVLNSHNIVSNRADIAEIGHLYAQNRPALMQLFVLLVQALHQLNIKQLVFAATTELKRLLTRHGIELSDVADASAECLGDKAVNWGSYYQSKPKVCVLSVVQPANRIQSDQRLVQLVFRHWPQLHILVNALQETI